MPNDHVQLCVPLSEGKGQSDLELELCRTERISFLRNLGAVLMM